MTHQKGPCVLNVESTLKHIISWSPWFTLAFILGGVHSMGLDKSMMTYIHH